MSRLRRLLTARRPPLGPPPDLQRIWRGLGTARTAHTIVRDDHNRDTVLRILGVTDFANDLERSVETIEDGCMDILRIGTEIYYRPPGTEPCGAGPRATGERWIWADSLPGCTNHGLHPAITMIERLGRLRSVTPEKRDGERLRRHVFLLRPSAQQEDPMAAELHRYLELHSTDQMTWELWLTADDRPWRVRSRVITPRSWRTPQGLISMTSEHWDFGIPDRLTRPSPEDIPPRPSEA
ncbi:hypothetical protein [Planomonospora sp. ID82291]|uniref:hypothetical protein n=1 Tax=Planomonospora sp. ID82291 TaxID=2738136 RepID=UPI0018C3E6E2|nr:hypothetical protein [Planomonospora sp. ID82291]MBG0816543.1 hypothetical protein [Planomonospora sp. ID82291]